MNDHDRDNFRFLMNCSTKEFEAFMEWADQDDIDYAIELVRQARAELTLQLVEAGDEVDNLTEAKGILQKFVLNGKVR